MARQLSSESEQGPPPSRQDSEGVSSLKRVRCSKNPGHRPFIPLSILKSDHLPEGFRSTLLADIIRLKGEETVRLTVGWTSPDRPQGLGFDHLKGTDTIRYGNGTTFSIDGMGRTRQCPEVTCPEKQGPHHVSGFFKIMTVAHVIFNDSEARRTAIEFFVDDERNTAKVVRAQGVRVTSIDLQNNISVVECITHDLGLYRKLKHFRTQKDRLISELVTSQANNASASGSSSKADLLTVLISHPHGSTKHVSFGQLTAVNPTGTEKANVKNTSLIPCRFNYSTQSCLGSGGGSVTAFCMTGRCVAFGPHSGVAEDGTNRSGGGWMKEEEVNVVKQPPPR